jgi:hypothetical protein
MSQSRVGTGILPAWRARARAQNRSAWPFLPWSAACPDETRNLKSAARVWPQRAHTLHRFPGFYLLQPSKPVASREKDHGSNLARRPRVSRQRLGAPSLDGRNARRSQGRADFARTRMPQVPPHHSVQPTPGSVPCLQPIMLARPSSMCPSTFLSEYPNGGQSTSPGQERAGPEPAPLAALGHLALVLPPPMRSERAPCALRSHGRGLGVGPAAHQFVGGRPLLLPSATAESTALFMVHRAFGISQCSMNPWSWPTTASCPTALPL